MKQRYMEGGIVQKRAFLRGWNTGALIKIRDRLNTTQGYISQSFGIWMNMSDRDLLAANAC